MPTIDPATLPELPAPVWFIQIFKVIGFVLHASAMNLWLAGAPLALIAYSQRGTHRARWAGRFMMQLPIILAFGINFGIVPLLFLQVAYYKHFYSATILMAWHWLGIIGLVVLVYYAAYGAAFDLRKEPSAFTRRRVQILIFVASAGLLLTGFFFANGLSLMTASERWAAMYEAKNVAGAATGFGLNAADPSMWARYALMIGLALVTTACWIVFDAAWFTYADQSDYRAWARQFGLQVASVGAVWSAVAGSVYLLATWSAPVRAVMFAPPMILLTGAIGLCPLLPAAWLFVRRKEELTRSTAVITASLGFLSLAMNGIGRQIVQNIEAAVLVDVLKLPSATQWSPLIAFLVTFILGIALIVWMLMQVRTARDPLFREQL